MRYFLVSVLLLAVLSFGAYSQDVGEMTEAQLLEELMQILEQQETKLQEQQTQIQSLEKHLQTAQVWQEALTQRISRLQTLHNELKQSWQSYREEKEREIKRLKFGWIVTGVVGAGLGGLNIYQAVK